MQSAVREVPPNLTRKLMDAAESLGPRFGDARMNDIASASGIPRPTLYYYFASKDDILAFLHRALLDDFNDRLETAPGADVRTRLRALVASHFEHLLGRPNSAQLVILNLKMVGKLDEIVGASEVSHHQPFRAILASAVENGELASMDVNAAAIAMSGAVHATAMNAIAHGASDTPDRLAERFVDLFWNGLRGADR